MQAMYGLIFSITEGWLHLGGGGGPRTRQNPSSDFI